MPWIVWGRHEGYCPDFGLAKHHGEYVLKCGTPNYSEFLTKQWYWRISGENLGKDLPDLISINFARDDNTLYAYQHYR